jgi:hypothetical protein
VRYALLMGSPATPAGNLALAFGTYRRKTASCSLLFLFSIFLHTNNFSR